MKKQPKSKQDRKTFAEVCRVLGKPAVYIHKVLSGLDLHIPAEREGYSPEYETFLRTVIALRTFGIPIDDIADLFNTEKKLLILLKTDTLSGSPTWYLDQCGKDTSEDRLLLTNYPIGGSVTESGIQSNLDFSNRAPELFKSAEMSEDARRVLASCRKKTSSIMTRVESDIPVLKDALSWGQVLIQSCHFWPSSSLLNLI